MKDEVQQNEQRNTNYEIMENMMGSQVDQGRAVPGLVNGGSDGFNQQNERSHKASSLIYSNEEVYMIPRQMSQQTH